MLDTALCHRDENPEEKLKKKSPPILTLTRRMLFQAHPCSKDLRVPSPPGSTDLEVHPCHQAINKDLEVHPCHQAINKDLEVRPCHQSINKLSNVSSISWVFLELEHEQRRCNGEGDSNLILPC